MRFSAAALLIPMFSSAMLLSQTNNYASNDCPVRTGSVLQMTECQGLNNCATWNFSNQKGLGRWPSGEEGILDFTDLGQHQITVTRVDVEGSKAGLTATYHGVVQDGVVHGIYTSKYNGKTETGAWYLVYMTPANTPLKITEWEGRDSRGVTWSFPASEAGTAGTGSFSGGPERIVLDRMDHNTVSVSRHQTDPRWGGSADYIGQICGDHVNGTITYWDKGHHNPTPGTWSGVIGDEAVSQLANPQQAPSPGMTVGQAITLVRSFADIANFLSPFLQPQE
jgi:hypothetical protein